MIRIIGVGLIYESEEIYYTIRFKTKAGLKRKVNEIRDHLGTSMDFRLEFNQANRLKIEELGFTYDIMWGLYDPDSDDYWHCSAYVADDPELLDFVDAMRIE
jgi:hypothetical protein